MNFLKDIFHLFFPRLCVICEEELVANEELICLACRFNLPTTNFIDEKDNMVERIFYGRFELADATSLLYYRHEGITQKLISRLKYKGNQEIGSFLGEWLGNELRESSRFHGVDCVVPVPLHPKKLKKRGFNQLTSFGKSIAFILKVPYVENILIKKNETVTQTKKGRFDRSKNVKEIYAISNADIFKDKHVLLIDDVITTGATLEACALEILKIKNTKLSIATMAFTD